MIGLRNVSSNAKDFEKIKRLYESAFPYKERMPIFDLLKNKNETTFCAVYDNELFCGFFCLLSFHGITHITYLAVAESCRDKGYGSKILQSIHKMKPQSRIIADIEMENSRAYNSEQRTRRKKFYIRNGYQETDIFYTWQDVQYQILSYGGAVSKSEFLSFWQHFEVEKNTLTQQIK